MKFPQMALAFSALMLFAGAAHAQASCADKAIDKNGKALAGAAKNSFMKKCEADQGAMAATCESKAIDKNGKALAGAAKNASVKKCMGAGKA